MNTAIKKARFQGIELTNEKYFISLRKNAFTKIKQCIRI